MAGTEEEGPVGTVAEPTRPGAGPDLRLPSMFAETTPTRVVALAALLLLALFAIPWGLDAFWLQIALTTVIYSLVTLGLGLLVGRVGLVSLCQVPLLAVGAWFALRVSQEWALPFPLLLLVTGILTGIVGIIIGLPAIRISGLYLALITLMAAGALVLLLGVIKLPNGGGGIWGYDRSVSIAVTRLDRPSIAVTDTGYFRYCTIVVAVLFAFVAWHIRGKPGRAWSSLRQSQVTAVAAGVNTTLYKLWAFALSAFITGVAGALLAAGPGGVTITQFPLHETIVLLAVVYMGGVYSIWGAVVAAFFLRFLPRLLDQQFGISTELLMIVFGIGIIVTLLTAPSGVAGQFEDLFGAIKAKLGRRSDVGEVRS